MEAVASDAVERRFFHFEAPDLGSGRTDAQFAFEIFELTIGSQGIHLHPPVVQVPGPALDAQIASHALRKISVSHSLNVP